MISSPDHTDLQLLLLLKNGDETAFTTLFERYRDRLYYYLLKHTKSAEIAEEIVTDIFMKLWTGRELVHQISDVAAFFHKVGYYKAMDFLRTTARHSRLQQVYINRMEPNAEKTADEILIDAEAMALLHKAINQLPPKRKAIYKLSREEGLSHLEIAKMLNLSPSTINNSMVSATRSIARYLEQQGTYEGALLLFIIFT